MKGLFWAFILFALIFGGYLFWTDFSVPVPKLNRNALSGHPALKVPEGFEISIAAKDLDSPRVILFDSKGRMLISETKAGRVMVLEDKDKNGEFEAKYALIENLKSPHGLAFYQDPKTRADFLYIAETHQIVRFSYDASTGKLAETAGKNIANLPDGGRHFTRTIAFGPNFRKKPILEGRVEKETLSETKLYISVGSSCDVCVEQSWKRAAILESDPEGSFTAEFAGGLRNAVFFTFHPQTKEIWATEMGRDDLGDDLPPDEINIIRVAGPEHKFGARRYGWPFCYGDKIKDIAFSFDEADRPDIPRDCGQTEPPAIEVPAHSAPLGLAFITEKKWPAQWQNNLLVAYHGSWNRSQPTGYKIVRFKVDKNGKVNGVEDFISGWLRRSNEVGAPTEASGLNNDGKIFGRPVGLKFGLDGALYISDDAAGVIYRVTPI